MVPGRGFPPRIHPLTFLGGGRRPVGRTRPLELVPLPPGRVRVVGPELDR